MSLRSIAVLAVVHTAALVSVVAQSPPARAIDRRLATSQVRAEFLHAWSSYQRLAAGHDELNPVSRTAHDWYPPSVVYMTPVDSLDTMLLMGLDAEADRASREIRAHLSFDVDVSVQVFEVNIRLLGGLISAYQMTRAPRFLELAEDLGHRLLPAFDSPTGMPYRFVNLRTGAHSGADSNPAEIGTLILEFGALSKLTKQDVFFAKAKRALVALSDRRSTTTGLVGEGINVDTGEWTSSKAHIGGGIDSYYEYLLKCARLFGDKDCDSLGRAGLQAVNRYLADTDSGKLWYGEADMNTGKRTATTYGSLQAFFPAVLALAGDLPRAKRLQDSNLEMWTLAGIEPEELDYAKMRIVSPGYQLRPEIAESAYYLFHYTRDPKYLEMGRTILDGLVNYCRVDDGYTVLRNVETKEKGDRMHSFLLAETFKYLYLLFAPPETLDFDRVTFNTEAHPIWKTWP